MDIDHPQTGDGEEVGWQNPAVRGNDTKIGVEFRQLMSELSFSKPCRLKNRGAECERGRLHFGWLNAMTSTARPVWLSDRAGDDVPAGRECLQ